MLKMSSGSMNWEAASSPPPWEQPARRQSSPSTTSSQLDKGGRWWYSLVALLPKSQPSVPLWNRRTTLDQGSGESAPTTLGGSGGGFGSIVSSRCPPVKKRIGRPLQSFSENGYGQRTQNRTNVRSCAYKCTPDIEMVVDRGEEGELWDRSVVSHNWVSKT